MIEKLLIAHCVQVKNYEESPRIQFFVKKPNIKNKFKEYH